MAAALKESNHIKAKQNSVELNSIHLNCPMTSANDA